MEQNTSLETDSPTANQEIPRFFWTRKLINVFTAATGPYPETVESSSHTPSVCVIHFNIMILGS